MVRQTGIMGLNMPPQRQDDSRMMRRTVPMSAGSTRNPMRVGRRESDALRVVNGHRTDTRGCRRIPGSAIKLVRGSARGWPSHPMAGALDVACGGVSFRVPAKRETIAAGAMRGPAG